jgi:chloramphenicol 3-O phosphotransferase
MSKIIFLNGCGSSGKTSISRSIQYLSDELWLTFGIDTFMDMIPLSKQESYLKFIPGENPRGHTMAVESGPKSKQLFGLMPKFANMLALEGSNLIIDEVLFGDSDLEAYVKSLSSHIVYYIGVFCDLNIMQEREILRGNRYIGLSNDQVDRVHQGSLCSYDFKVDTSHCSSFKAAHQILEFVRDNPAPKSFQDLINQL